MLKRIALLLSIPAALAAGCNQVRDPIQPRQDLYRTGNPEQVFLDSTNLRNDVAADTPQVFRDQFGLLHVTVPIRSVINRQLYVEYRVIFFDSAHQVIDRSPWQDKTLAANLPDSVTIVSSTAGAADFQVHFRYPPSTEYRE